MSGAELSDKFLRPFYKLFARQLREAWPDGKDIWRVKLDDRTTLDCQMVWLQGNIVALSLQEDELAIEDISGARVKVVNCSASPGASSWIQIGQYIQVIGAIEQAGVLPTIRCTKLADRSDNFHEQSMWEVEVRELQNLLCKKIKLIN